MIIKRISNLGWRGCVTVIGLGQNIINRVEHVGLLCIGQSFVLNFIKLIKQQTGSINQYQQSVYLASLDRHSEQAAAGLTDDILS